MTDQRNSFVVRRDAQREWYWVFYGANGEALARSSESYKRRGDCKHSILLVQGSRGVAIVEAES